MATSGKVAKLTNTPARPEHRTVTRGRGGVNWSSVLSFLIINCMALLVV
jgi:hypothetical protein